MAKKKLADTAARIKGAVHAKGTPLEHVSAQIIASDAGHQAHVRDTTDGADIIRTMFFADRAKLEGILADAGIESVFDAG